MIDIVQAQLATDLNCAKEDFDKDGFIFCPAKENIGRRPFPRGERYFEMTTMGKAIIVSATPDILPYVKEQLEGKSRDDAFAMPFVYGHSMYYLPDLNVMTKMPLPEGFQYEMLEQAEIPSLYSIRGFVNAIGYDVNHPRPDVLAILSKYNGSVIGIAGASRDCAKMWQIGIDVLPEFRRHGLAAALVNRLALEIVDRGFVPYYGTASSNIPSQRVAHRAGFQAAWMCCYRGRFDDGMTESTS